jgi:RNA polymerase sigma-70 factor (ECF subfamily)
MSLLDPELVGRLAQAHAPALELFARQRCDAPQDIVQEAFLKLFRQPELPQKVLPWLFRVVRNEAIAAARKRRRRQKHETARAGATTGWFRPADEGPLDANEAAAALATLPIEEREIIVAHVWGGLTFEQIAELTDVSSSTAHRHYTTGILKLRERLLSLCPSTNTTKSRM